ncbi:hypothetical protein ADL22_16385 [Streptomyces sp. NRRL F-4489]|uniref:hypothetical protein n=1 Tax=Streptomyces sp. NRRL F-4489 TaxID=1609095 RepID=UPI0007471F72|nr:hypothetical protein [Streptomyces sp. NRRL F-4489]KUL38842.1 hypothetical protein ADL22_16385 [Streptomyces sp. NRRL F-4489]
MTPYSLAFYVDVVSSGTVLGARPTDSPDQVTGVLGPEFAENSFDPSDMWRDYGLAEFFWSREDSGQPWTGHHFTLQVHRLAHGRCGAQVNAEIRDRYGRFARRLRFDKLQRLLLKRGTPLVEVPEARANSPYYRTYWQPDSLVSVTTIAAHGEYSTPDNLRIGDVYSIGALMTPDEVEWRRKADASG